MNDFVSKPIRAGELAAALERCGLGVALAEIRHRPTPDEAVFDLAALETTRSLPGMAGPSLLPEMVKLYLSDEAERLERLERLASERQPEELAQEAHSFGGNAASFGAIQIRRVALELESAARAQNWTAVAERMIELRQACARLKGEIAQLNLLSP